MLPFLRRIWKEISTGQNLDVYSTVFLSILIAVLGLFSIAQPNIIFAAVLATLALLASGLLANRRQNDEIKELLERANANTGMADRFFQAGDDIKEVISRIRQSRKVLIWGASLTTHIPLLQEEIEKGLELGLEVKCLLLKPKSNAVAMAAFRGKNTNTEDLNVDLERNIARLKSIATRAKKGKLECRTIDYLAPYAFYAFDYDQPSGYMILQMSALRTANNIRPRYTLNRSVDSHWFDFHLQQFEIAWQSSEDS